MKKKAPRKYAAGGNVRQIKSAENSTTPDPLNKGKKLKDSTFKEEGEDYLRLLGKTAATPLGLNNAPMFQEDKFNTKLGKQGSGITDKYIAPVTRAVGATALSIVGTPLAGQAYLGATSSVDQSQQKKYAEQNAQTIGETDLAYQNRMAAKGIDVNDTKVGLQGTEGLMAAGLSAGYGVATKPPGTGIKGLTTKKKKSTSSDLAVQQQEAELDAEIAENPQGDIRTTQRQGFKKGGNVTGVVKGKGGPKDDKVKGNLPKGAFVIPAENKEVGKGLVKALGKDSNKKSNLKGKGVAVAVSPTEVIIDPKDKPKANTVLKSNGIAGLSALAPNAKEGNKFGGGTPPEGVNGEPLSGEALLVLKKKYLNKQITKAEYDAAIKTGKKPIADTRNEVIEKMRKDTQKKRLEENIEKTKKTLQTYKDRGLVDESERTEKELNNFQAQYNKEYPSATKKEDEKKVTTEKPTTANQAETEKSSYSNVPDKKPNMNLDGAIQDKVEAQRRKQQTTTPGSGIAKVKTSTTNPVVKTPINKEESLNDYNKQWLKSMQEGQAFNAEKAKKVTTGKEEAQKRYDQDYANIAAMDAANKNKEAQVPAIDKQTFGLETGLGLFQAGYGLQQLRKDGKRPAYQVPSELTNSLARANEDAKYGFDNATGEAYQRGIEGARIQNVALANQLGGGNAAAVQNNARASTNQLGQGMLNFYSKDAQLQLQKKQYADQLGKAVASEKDRGFQYKMDAFNQNQRAGADLLGAGISNIFTMRKNQRELDAQKSFAQNNNFDKNNYNKWAAANNQPLIP